MSNRVLFFGWNRPVAGREKESGELFTGFTQYLVEKQQEGAIDSFEPVLLSAHGGDLNGFILIRGSEMQLNTLASSEDWIRYEILAGINLEGSGLIRGVTNEGVGQWMALWQSLL